MLDVRIYSIIGIFMVTCLALILYNFIAIRYSKRQSTPDNRKIKKWHRILYRQIGKNEKKAVSSLARHEKLLLTKMPRVEHLIAYGEVLAEIKKNFPQEYDGYVAKHKNIDTFQKLAQKYRSQGTIERTCFADFIGTFPELADEVDWHGPLVDILISYIGEDSNLYCRGKVLRALCRLGSEQGVANVIQIFHEKALFMHNQVIVNELSFYQGDQKSLKMRLWREVRLWNDQIGKAVIQFITGFSKPTPF